MPARHHGMFTNGTSPLIVSMSPETVAVHDGHASMARYSLSYEIDNPEKAKKAYISVYALGIGEVQHFDVDVEQHAQIEFLLDASAMDLGPKVRFRVRCPAGDSDWFTLGAPPQVGAQPSSGIQIDSVDPPYISPKSIIPGVGARVIVRGAKITHDCKLEADVADAPAALQNVAVYDREIRGVLPYEVLQGRGVAARYLEVNLVVEAATGMPAADTFKLNFDE